MRTVITVALSALVLVGCQPPPSPIALESEPPQDSAASEPEVYTPVYDPEAIEVMIREVPESSEWAYVWAHLQAINDQAELGPGIPLEAELSPTVNPEMAEATIDAYSKAMGTWSFFGVDEVPAA